jgi:CMP-N-acetylneuraminic acid synthetase
VSRLGLVALVPMRHSSERVPEKNVRILLGRPLYAYVLGALAACKGVDRIVVDTDSPTIREGLAATFPQVQVLERPEGLRGGDVPMNRVLAHDVSLVEADIYLQTHSTNPLVRTATFQSAIAAFHQAPPDHDALFSVTALRKRLWTHDLKAVNHDPGVLRRTQDLDPVYEENSCIYLFRREAFLETGNRLGRHPLAFEMDPAEAWDIDEESDIHIVEALLAARGEP